MKPVVKRRRSRLFARGGAMAEIVIVIGILGVGTAAALVAAGERMHTEYRQDRRLLGSPYP